MRPEATAIPENREPDGRLRPLDVGPVFYVDPKSGALGMRYAARKRNVIWRDDPATRRAAERLEAILETDPLVLGGRLSPGEGLICNNVLHDRARFDDAAGFSIASGFTIAWIQPGGRIFVARISEILIANPRMTSFFELERVVVEAAKAGEIHLFMDIEPEFPDLPRLWEQELEVAFQRAEPLPRG